MTFVTIRPERLVLSKHSFIVNGHVSCSQTIEAKACTACF